MITALTLLVGAGIAAAAGTFGWLAGRRAGRAEAQRALPAGTMCSCGHGYGMHEDEHACHGRNRAKRNGIHHLDPCPCRRYDGPEPLPRVWTPIELDG
ncbi:hypothetical protein ACQEVB_20150 [Pseudonocardia sp. CA-107938]|uniref:hypothetical protein n=1 Tax=Pseudonocardia sp. CA-107938 TaxID=3240021 RepID=UPI003D93128A